MEFGDFFEWQIIKSFWIDSLNYFIDSFDSEMIQMNPDESNVLIH